MPSPEMVPSLRHVATFCGKCSCGCPELLVDEAAPPERRIVVTDDFGQRIQMSLGQLHDLVEDVKSGVLDPLVTGVAPAAAPAAPGAAPAVAAGAGAGAG